MVEADTDVVKEVVVVALEISGTTLEWILKWDNIATYQAKCDSPVIDTRKGNSQKETQSNNQKKGSKTDGPREREKCAWR